MTRRTLILEVDPSWLAAEPGTPKGDQVASEIGMRVLDLVRGTWDAPTPSDLVIATVASAYGISPREVTGLDRGQPATEARQVAAYLLMHVLRLPCTRTGRLLARDHTTVLHGSRRIAERIADDARFAAFVERLEDQARARLVV